MKHSFLGSLLNRNRNCPAVYSRTKKCGQMVGLPITLEILVYIILKLLVIELEELL